MVINRFWQSPDYLDIMAILDQLDVQHLFLLLESPVSPVSSACFFTSVYLGHLYLKMRLPG